MDRAAVASREERLALCELLAAGAAALVGVATPEVKLRPTRAGGKARGSSRRPVLILDADHVCEASAVALASLIGHEVGHLMVPGWRRRLELWSPLPAVLALCAAVAVLGLLNDGALMHLVLVVGTPVTAGLMLLAGPRVLQNSERRADGVARWLVGPTAFGAGLAWQDVTYPGPAGPTRRSDWHLRPTDRGCLARGPAATDPGPLLEGVGGERPRPLSAATVQNDSARLSATVPVSKGRRAGGSLVTHPLGSRRAGSATP